MTDHTPEPWGIKKEGPWAILVGKRKGVPVSLAYDMLPSDAARIVACVNACAGIPTEQLESEDSVWNWLEQLRQALEFYATAWEGHPGDSGPGGNTPADPEQWPSEDLLDDGGYAARAALAPFREDEP